MEPLFAILIVLSLAYGVCYLRAGRTVRRLPQKGNKLVMVSDVKTNVSSKNQTASVKTRSKMHSVEHYKHLYHSLHHVDENPDILKSAEYLLQSLLHLTDRLAQEDQTSKSIMKIQEYTEPELSSYMRKMEDDVQDEFSAYCQGRRMGQSRALFETVEDAAQWLMNISPVKLVDGAWLGNLRVATAPFELQPILRVAWQVLSEELGDGVLAQNHVHVFENLIRSVIADFPDAHSKAFVDCHAAEGNDGAWRSALAQLIISLFPDRYVPEILGFNMNFELVTLETLQASSELKEIGLDPLYFLLHICIDNSDIGHTAMALDTVIKYMRYIRQTEGDDAVYDVWRRVKAGFALSQYVGQISNDDAARYIPPPRQAVHDPLESQVIEIFKKKTQAARSVHCTSLVRFKGLSLEEWLAPERWDSSEWQIEFIDVLSNSKPWVIKGNQNRSRLMRELNWGGKMFGAFTSEESEIVGQWIDGMEPDGQTKLIPIQPALPTPLPTAESPLSFHGKTPALEQLLPLWFSSAGLLENFCAVPAHTTTPFVMHILSTLRSQSGLGQTSYGTAGPDEVPRSASLSLSSIGQEMVHTAGLPLPKSVYGMLETWPSEFGNTMMNLSTSARMYGDYLIGMALAFANLHEAMATSKLLCTATQTALLAMARSELFHLEQCKSQLLSNEESKLRFNHGYWLARSAIEKAFVSHPEPAVVVTY